MNFFKVNKDIEKLAKKVEANLAGDFNKIDEISSYNESKVLRAFLDNRVSEIHFNGTTGYGYNDLGRDVLDRIYSQVFGAEDAIVRHNFVSGTHALSIALFGVLRPGDSLVSVTGNPYDTIQKVIGTGQSENNGSLMDYGVKYNEIDLLKNGNVDFDEINRTNWKEIKVAYMQRSRGYSSRSPLGLEQIKKICDIIHSNNKHTVIFVDNCYGEFVCKEEPTNVGADLMAGSLIKNPGGGIANTGGYIVGRKDLVELCSHRFTAPGIGREVGCTLAQNKNMYMGLFLAPSVVSNALKVSAFSRALFDKLGYIVFPKTGEQMSDIISVLQLNSEEALTAFFEGIQSGSPVDSFVVPEAWDMPGYKEKVIMAAGTFTSGASIELSADAPIKEPYNAYLQGGLTYNSGKICVLLALQRMIDKGIFRLKFSDEN